MEDGRQDTVANLVSDTLCDPDCVYTPIWHILTVQRVALLCVTRRGGKGMWWRVKGSVTKELGTETLFPIPWRDECVVNRVSVSDLDTCDAVSIADSDTEQVYLE